MSFEIFTRLCQRNDRVQFKCNDFVILGRIPFYSFKQKC